ncbi:ATP-binding protein [Saccharothrix lopnurensis]|uniref:ATP-binding protein n=1 Tax=Saccharothrix lopnurensis TaxID=1670621 RepID=A0ABW1P3Q0_9PSEU
MARNVVSGDAGRVVQAGAVHGDVHLHAPPPPSPVVPRQLPAAPGVFTGRAAELAALDAAGTAVMISAIGGTGGIGKTWLALAWAHRNRHRFPDGQLFVDLRGFSPTGRPTDPADAVRGFLTALGVDPGALPPDLDAQTALYRSLVVDRHVLVVLDNAATADQVVPLLPGTPTCTVLVTGRVVLSSLIDRHGARHLPLDVLTRAEARDLLTARLGDRRVDAEPDVTHDLVGLCGRHPLALAIIARHAATHPTIPLAEFAAELRESGLDALDSDDPAAGLPAVLSWSLGHLTDEQRVVFALLGIAPGPDIDVPAAASLTGLPEAHRVLRVLEGASLLDRHPHGRYAMHDLVRAYAAATARDLPEPVRSAALERVVDFYLNTAHTAERLLNPHRAPIRPDPPTPGTRPLPLPDPPAGLAWLETHHPHLLAAQHTAVTRHRHQAVWHLAWVLNTFHQLKGHRHDSLAAWRAAADAAEHLPDPAIRTAVHRLLGRAHTMLGEHEQAIGHLNQALTLAEHHHDPDQQAHTHYAIARAWGQRGDDRRALGHARRALELYRDSGRAVQEATALNAVGWFAARLGDHRTARGHCRAALDLFRRHHIRDGEAAALDSLGFVDHRTGHHDRAVHHYRQALTLFRAVGYTVEVTGTLDRLGHPHTALGQVEQAREVWREALGLYRQMRCTADADRVQRQLDDLGP